METYLIDEKEVGNYLIQMEANEEAGVIRTTLSKTENGWRYDIVSCTHKSDRESAYEDFNNFIATAERNERR